MIKDLEFDDFVEIYDEELYCTYMETGCYYEMERDTFDEMEYEEYLLGKGQWISPKQIKKELDTPVKL